MSYLVYGKENCKFCTAAKNLLDAKGKKYTYKQIGVDTTKEELLEFCKEFGIIPRTVPQIFCDSFGEMDYIGGFEELEKAIKFDI